jgi:hypothetical protein
MEDFFNTIYYWTNSLYSQELDNYLYENVAGYLHIGFVMVVISFLVSAIFYYMLKPVRHQIAWWFGFFGINALVNFIFALYYTWTPLINNEISSSEEWSYLDGIFMGISDIMWAFCFYVIAALILKWKSPCKYVPFRKF